MSRIEADTTYDTRGLKITALTSLATFGAPVTHFGMEAASRGQPMDPDYLLVSAGLVGLVGLPAGVIISSVEKISTLSRQVREAVRTRQRAGLSEFPPQATGNTHN